MTAVACGVERSSNSECPMSYNDNSDNAHEDLQRLIDSKSPSNLEKRQWQRKKEIKGMSWTCSGIIIIDILNPVPADSTSSNNRLWQ